MLTLHELKEKLDEGLFIELTVGNRCVKWYPVEQLESLINTCPLSNPLRMKCEIIVSCYKSGKWIAGRPPGRVERKIASIVLTHWEASDFAAVYFPVSLLRYPLDLLQMIFNQFFSIPTSNTEKPC